MSKRCKLQKEYYKEFGNYKGSGKYTDHYVNWLESKVLAINYTHCCKSDSEQLKDRKIKDLLNWVKSDLKQETNNKIGKTATPYRTDKIRFLNKLLELQNL